MQPERCQFVFPSGRQAQVVVSRLGSDAIVAHGGRLEVLFHCIFSAYVPKNETAESTFSLENRFDEAAKEWFNSSTEDGAH
jgi:hypothetical protein